MLQFASQRVLTCILVRSRRFAVLRRYLLSGAGRCFGLGSRRGFLRFFSTSIRFWIDLVRKLYLSKAGIFIFMSPGSSKSLTPEETHEDLSGALLLAASSSSSKTGSIFELRLRAIIGIEMLTATDCAEWRPVNTSIARCEATGRLKALQRSLARTSLRLSSFFVVFFS